MAKDDYYVVVYKILAYLYVQLKNGADIEAKILRADGPLLGINTRYWTYIMENLQSQGYIRGITIVGTWGSEKMIENLEECQITPEGIEFLCDHSLMEKAKSFLKDIKEITPFI